MKDCLAVALRSCRQHARSSIKCLIGNVFPLEFVGIPQSVLLGDDFYAYQSDRYPTSCIGRGARRRKRPTF